MKLNELLFRRRFSVNLYRNLRLKMGEMSLYKNWVDDRCGDPYPLLETEGTVTESVGHGVYRAASVEKGRISRLLGSFFPWNTYEIKLSSLQSASVGFRIDGAAGEILVRLDGEGATLHTVEGTHRFDAQIPQNAVFSVTFLSQSGAWQLR